MIPVVIYTRYSPGGRQNDQSTEGQLRDCYSFCEREGYTVIAEYNDRLITGRTDTRPNFQQMIEDAAKGQFRYIVVWTLDRFARNRYDSAMYKTRLKKCGVKVISATENISDSPEGIILEGLLESMAEYYSANLSKNIKRGRRESALKGKFLGGGIVAGYKVHEGRLVLDEEKAPIMREAYTRYANGERKKEVLEYINALGLRSRTGKPFGPSAFEKAMQSEINIGTLVQDGVRVEGACPALIDKDTFDRMQIRLKVNRHTGAKNKAKIEYLLSGKLFCGHCGTSMPGVSGTARNGETHAYYTCMKRRQTKTCTKNHERKGFLEWFITEQTILYVLTPGRTEYIAEAVVKEHEKGLNSNQIKTLERRIAKLDRDMEQYTDMLLEVPNSARAKIYQRMEKNDLVKSDIEAELSKLRLASNIKLTTTEVIAWIQQFCRGDQLDEVFQRRIIDVFVNSVYLYDNKVVIFYNLRNAKQVSYVDMLEATEEITFDDEPTESGSYINRCAPP